VICHLSTLSRSAYETSPNQTPIDKRRIKTIFNHFRDKPARFWNICNTLSLNNNYTNFAKVQADKDLKQQTE